MSKVLCPDCKGLVTPHIKAPHKKPYVFVIPKHSPVQGDKTRGPCPSSGKIVKDYVPAGLHV